MAGAALAALLLVPPLLVVAPPGAAAQSGALNTVQAQIRRYGCHLPQYATSVAGCRELHARAKALGARKAAAPAAPRHGLFDFLFGGSRDSHYRSNRDLTYFFSPAPPVQPTYRTLCVRLCDGYYWPISYSTRRSRFSRDAQQCESSCGVPARLFVHRNPGGSVESMVDLEGKPYSRLPHAFRYRQEYVGDCRCRPDPWTEEAKAEYARRAETALADAQATPAAKTAGAAHADTGLASRPQPPPRRRRLFDSWWPFSRWTNDS